MNDYFTESKKAFQLWEEANIQLACLVDNEQQLADLLEQTIEDMETFEDLVFEYDQLSESPTVDIEENEWNHLQSVIEELAYLIWRYQLEEPKKTVHSFEEDDIPF